MNRGFGDDLSEIVVLHYSFWSRVSIRPFSVVLVFLHKLETVFVLAASFIHKKSTAHNQKRQVQETINTPTFQQQKQSTVRSIYDIPHTSE